MPGKGDLLTDRKLVTIATHLSRLLVPAVQSDQ
jgi:hypothetical protein